MGVAVKVALASDSSGFRLKEAVKAYLQATGYEVVDVGQTSEDGPVSYVDAASSLAGAVQSGPCRRGIVICGTGAGVSLVANKFKGIYCVPCESLYTAQRSSLINNANVLAMGERIVGHEMACEMAGAWLRNGWCDGFDGERRERNMRGFQALQEIEGRNLK
ncbi:RpiB/LacA/LacB family sugar-phosphate isomerase [Azospirillum sp. YIM B02556]|uniref:RpiB/LacA/LacB family sugar-phosphate isomerase n=1 Tax=Azospirillum endophyticum TaxID=2800326 RepID=A0ABS1FBR8_9PROT|nr:RpiB/LacA/LacB family sugar-phosphate isomerase [Azospirillum endophyticum]MBK1840866.1 RpiB/LacA/LacB family sugar-phosphate isomerase [Azospirillum endophyticum]